MMAVRPKSETTALHGIKPLQPPQEVKCVSTNDKKQLVIKEEIHIPEGFEGVCLKGHTVLYISGKVETELPEAFDPHRDFIREILPGESGRGLTNTGAAIINCNQSGMPLKGFKIQKSGSGKFSTGHLFVSGIYISVNVARQGNLIGVSITKSKVKFTNEVQTIWEYNGHIDHLSFPMTIEKYKTAVNAAIDKSMCYHCRCLHFYK